MQEWWTLDNSVLIYNWHDSVHRCLPFLSKTQCRSRNYVELSAKRLICQRTDGRDDRERSQELGFEFERRASSDSEREGTVEMKLIFRTAWTRSHRLNGGHSIPESGPVIYISLVTRWECSLSCFCNGLFMHTCPFFNPLFSHS